MRHIYPVVTIGDTEYGRRRETQESAVIADINISWGRDSVYDQAGAATATVTLMSLDPGVLYRSNFLGTKVEIEYSDLPGVLRGTMYIGVVSEQKMIPREAPDGSLAGYYAELTCSDIRVQLENSYYEYGSLLPTEPINDRLDRIIGEFDDPYNLLQGSKYSNLPIPSDVTNDLMELINDQEGRSLAELLDEVFDTASSAWTYNPDDRHIYVIPIDTAPPPEKIVLREDAGSPRRANAKSMQKELVLKVVNDYDGETREDGVIPGRYCVSDGELSRSAADEITEIRVNWDWINEDGEIQTDTEIATAPGEVADFQAASMEKDVMGWSWHAITLIPEKHMNVANNLRDKWVPAPVTYKSSLARETRFPISYDEIGTRDWDDGGFPEDDDVIRTLLTGGASDRRVFISSRREAALEQAPTLYSIVSGEIAYYADKPNHPGYWEIEMQPVPIVERMPPVDPIRWGEIPKVNAGSGSGEITLQPTDIIWNSNAIGDGPRIADSVSWQDLKLVSKD